MRPPAISRHNLIKRAQYAREDSRWRRGRQRTAPLQEGSVRLALRRRLKPAPSASARCSPARAGRRPRGAGDTSGGGHGQRNSCDNRRDDPPPPRSPVMPWSSEMVPGSHKRPIADSSVTCLASRRPGCIGPASLTAADVTHHDLSLPELTAKTWCSEACM
ncbi:hypothetical protein E2C01_038312 [Portunus trituberculatus]|uniref:Uncharacterized protein n=1 Tax=Portunus trituberculatus TaxID=210409 RepID=A0A5B7FGH2_PORTR|nr:hypothetical protein [Portunus trituberculatus]